MPKPRLGYVFNDNSPLFPFGFGLSYTTFTLGKPAVDRPAMGRTETAKISISVTNTGQRVGDQVVQMYIHHPVSSIAQPVILLRGFKRVHLEPGASATVSFDVGPEQLSILDAQMKWTVEPGGVDVLIGPNSAETSKAQLVIAE
jgi:beta-glucosidase